MEKWKEIKGFKNCYEVSNLGNVRSIDRCVKHYRGGLRKYKGSGKSLRYDKNGYTRCNLNKDGKRFDFRVHRLVADAFLDNKLNKKEVNHINGIKDDNNVNNLEWCTSSENRLHATKNRLIKTKLTDKQALEIYNSNKTQRVLSCNYGVNASIIWRIKNKKAYKHIFI